MRPILADLDNVKKSIAASHKIIDGWLERKADPQELDEIEDALAWSQFDAFDAVVYLAKSCDWYVNEKLFEVLSDVVRRITEDHKAAVKQWIEQNQIVLRFKIGDKVKFNGQDVEVIREIKESAQYLVRDENGKQLIVNSELVG